MLKSLALLVFGFISGTLFITYPYNKAHETFCFKDERVGVVMASHLDAIEFLVLSDGRLAGAPGALADFRQEKQDDIIACPSIR